MGDITAALSAIYSLRDKQTENGNYGGAGFGQAIWRYTSCFQTLLECVCVLYLLNLSCLPNSAQQTSDGQETEQKH